MCVGRSPNRSRTAIDLEARFPTTDSASVTPPPLSVTPEPEIQQAGRKRPRKKSVHFAPSECTVVAFVPARSEISQEERSDVWFGPLELDAIKDHAREVSNVLRQRAAESAASASVVARSDGESPDGESEALRRYREKCARDSLVIRTQQQQLQVAQQVQCHAYSIDEEDLACSRGLDVRLSYERQRNKYLAARAILESSRRLSSSRPSSPIADPSMHLALVSSKVSRWAREVALSTAQGDFLSAYEIFKGVLPQPRTLEEITREHPFPIGLKRKSPASSAVVTLADERRVRRRIAC